MTISAIIAAYNEAGRIQSVLAVLNNVPAISEIIVVDDASSDETADVAQAMPKVRVVRHHTNRGKTEAVKSGIAAVQCERILLCDADLIGLDATYLEEAIKQPANDKTMVIIDYSGQELFLKHIVFVLPAVSGLRLVSRALLDEVGLQTGNPWQLEARLNRHCFERQYTIKIVTSPGLKSPLKWAKYGIKSGLKMAPLEIKQIYLVFGWRGLPRFLADCFRLRFLTSHVRL